MSDTLLTVRDAAALVGVDLRGEDGQPFHCGQRMHVKVGIFGPDYARCACGVELRNMASPHVNGGYVPDATWFEARGDRTWMAFRRSV